MSFDSFHPAVRNWFNETFEAPTDVQLQAWDAISDKHHTLIAAPTGSGKTLAAFLAVIDELVKESLLQDTQEKTTILYVSPLKALSNDIHKNLEEPLAGIQRHLMSLAHGDIQLTSAVRSGDTTQYERTRMRRSPPNILVTTPESLFILLSSDSGRDMLSTVKTVIVDEIHAVISNKRGSHLALSLERLEALTGTDITRIGLSATQKPIHAVADFLIGQRGSECKIIDCGYQRERDLELILPETPLTALMSQDDWQQIYDKLAELIEAHSTTLIFVNTRRLAERAARFLAERIGEEYVTAHHGSLAKEHRLQAEQKLKNGELKALVATASLELGIDIGNIDLVCQLGSPRSISTFLQRIGRSGHRIGAIPKGRLFPLTRDDLVECTALLYAINQNRLDQLAIPQGHLDVLAQHIIAEVACREWSETELLQMITRSWSYKKLEKETFYKIIDMLVNGYTTRRGPRSRYLFRDSVNQLLKPRKGAKLTAVTNAGAIPDQFDYDVILEPEGHNVGSLNEDFAFESLAGDIFQLGNTSYRILQVHQGKVRVVDANGQPPNIPFWFGEAPGRSDELSRAVSDIRELVAEQVSDCDEAAIQLLQDKTGIDELAARQLNTYLALSKAALGDLPTFNKIIFERFFDDNGDQHLVIHSPYGSRVNRAWGLALRKRFCRQFNFELQAAALDDYIVLSLGATHSFPLEDVRHFLKSNTVRDVLIQAMLAAPMFATHWRWNATIALAIKRFINGKKAPAPFQRSDAEDLMALIFPDQLACQENLAGDREIPDHPLVQQTVDDCLHDIMDINTLERLIQSIEHDEIEIICQDLSAPSPLAEEILHARPYAFLDDAPAEERRTRSVTTQQILETTEASQLKELDPAAIQKVEQEAWPVMQTIDELHDAMYQLGFLQQGDIKSEKELNRIRPSLNELIKVGRAFHVSVNDIEFWVCVERLEQFQIAFPGMKTDQSTAIEHHLQREITFDQDSALLDLLRSRLSCLPLITETELATSFGLSPQQISSLLANLEHEGFAIQLSVEQVKKWCERGLLARIRRYGLSSLRKQIRAVDSSRFMQFLFQWQGLGRYQQSGEQSLLATLERLEGFACPAGVWESEIIPARIQHYISHDLDQLFTSGRYMWMRVPAKPSGGKPDAATSGRSGILKNTPVLIVSRFSEQIWRSHTSATDYLPCLSSTANKVYSLLKEKGASFFLEIVQQSGLLRTQTEDALAELAASGLITSDSFSGLRALIAPAQSRKSFRHRYRGGSTMSNIDAAGRWSIISDVKETDLAHGWIQTDLSTLEHIARTLLRRYGVVFYQLLQRESRLPPWRELLYVFRRLEARGEIRGGRFVEGFSGEQFALPEAVGLLHKSISNNNEIICISACDPLNLVGIITPGEKIASLGNTRIAFKNGRLAGKQVRNQIDYFEKLDPAEEWEIKTRLTRKTHPASYIESTQRNKH